MGAIRNLCPRSILLDAGRLTRNDDTEAVIAEYLTANANHDGHWTRSEERSNKEDIYLTEVAVSNGSNEVTGSVDSNRPFNIFISLMAKRDLVNAQIHTRITNQEGVILFTTANTDAGGDTPISKGAHTYNIEIPKNLLPPGVYEVTVGVMIPKVKLFDIVENELLFAIEDVGSHATILRDGRRGVVTPLLSWKEIHDHPSQAI